MPRFTSLTIAEHDALMKQVLATRARAREAAKVVPAKRRGGFFRRG